MIVSNYTKLFSIEFVHSGYNNMDDILQEISVLPDEETIRLMNSQRLHHAFDRNILFCFIETISSVDTKGGSVKVVTENKPRIRFDTNDQLIFNLVVKSGRFVDHSDLRLFDTKNNIFRFANDSGNRQNSRLYLSHAIPPYHAADSYQVGMLVTASGRNFEAIRPNDAANAHDTSDNQYWKDVTDGFQYANQSDLVNDETGASCFGVIQILFRKNLPNDFSLLKTSAIPADDDTIQGIDYHIQFKRNEIN